MSKKAKVVKFLGIIGIGVIYFVVIADGLRIIFAALNKKVSELPVPYIHHLDKYNGIADIDLAHCFAIIVFVVIYFTWDLLIKNFLFDDHMARQDINSFKLRRFVEFFGTILILAEGVLFYIGIQGASIWELGFSFSCLVGTLVYMVTMCFATFFFVLVEKEIEF